MKTNNFNSVLLVPSSVIHRCVIRCFNMAICASATVISIGNVITGEDIILETESEIDQLPVATFVLRSLSVIIPIGFEFSTMTIDPT